MRNLNNGKLTAGDKRVVNAQQNKLSRNIYRDKTMGGASNNHALRASQVMARW